MEYDHKPKMFTVLAEYTRECLKIRVGKKIDSRHVPETSDELMTERGVPRYTPSDNGPKLVSNTLTESLREKGLEPVFIEPGNPSQNGCVESFHRKLRDQCLNEEMFWSHGEARVVLHRYPRVYNREPPRGSLGYRTPEEVASGSQDRNQPQLVILCRVACPDCAGSTRGIASPSMRASVHRLRDGIQPASAPRSLWRQGDST